MAMLRSHRVGEEATWPLQETQSFPVERSFPERTFTLDDLANRGTGNDYELRPPAR